MASGESATRQFYDGLIDDLWLFDIARLPQYEASDRAPPRGLGGFPVAWLAPSPERNYVTKEGENDDYFIIGSRPPLRPLA